MTQATSTRQLRELARRIRLRDLEMIYEAGAGHLGSEFSSADILTTLYFHVMKYDAAKPKWFRARPFRPQ